MLLFVWSAFATDWTVLQNEQVHVECRSDVSTCRAHAWVDASPDDIRSILTDLEHYPTTFQTVTHAAATNEQVELVFELPWYLGDWHATCTSSLLGDTLTLSVVKSKGRTPLFDALELSIAAEGASTRIDMEWHHDRPWPPSIDGRINRSQGHNFVWGIAQAAGVRPRSTPTE